MNEYPTARDELLTMGIMKAKNDLEYAKEMLKQVNNELEKYQKSRPIWLDEVDRLGRLLARLETE